MLQRSRRGEREREREIDKYLTQSTVSNAHLLSDEDADPNLTSIMFAHS